MWFYIKICQNQQFAFLVMCDVWYGRLKLYTIDYSYGHKYVSWYLVGLYRVICGLLEVICGLGRPIQSDVRSCQGNVRYSYAHKFVMCGDVW